MRKPNFPGNIFIRSLICLLITCLLSSCATYRGMPTHGGGKRFDEEQRVVAAAIRKAVYQLDLSAIRSKRVALKFSNLETSGSGQPIYPGLGNLNLNTGYFDGDSYIRRTGATTSNFESDDGGSRWDGRASANFEFNPSLRTNNNITREDINYLQEVVEMQLRHSGLQIVAAPQAEVLLIVLVDVLGTNLSRIDYGLAYRDELGASCELTYYAINPKNQVIISPAKSLGAYGSYEETNLRFTPFRSKAHHIRLLDTALVNGLAAAPEPQTISSEVELDSDAEQAIDSKLDALYQRTLIQIESNDRNGAAASIARIRALDPDFSFLPELQQQFDGL